jgi:hypothetical protein
VIEQPEWQIGVFPYKSVNGVVEEWNSVVRRRDPGEERWQVVVLKPKPSPEQARASAQLWIDNRFK